MHQELVKSISHGLLHGPICRQLRIPCGKQCLVVDVLKFYLSQTTCGFIGVFFMTGMLCLSTSMQKHAKRTSETKDVLEDSKQLETTSKTSQCCFVDGLLLFRRGSLVFVLPGCVRLAIHNFARFIVGGNVPSSPHTDGVPGDARQAKLVGY